MNVVDPLELDGRLLLLLVRVAETGSITRAADRLGLTQSAVSHGLDRLRAVTGDALVVRAGRGIALTPRARELAEQARAVLVQLRAFAEAPPFDPSTCQLCVRVAANPLQRDLLLPRWLALLQASAPGLTLRVEASEAPGAELLRDPGMHLVITPRPPEDADLCRDTLFEDEWRVFYDPAARAAPTDRAAYEASEHVTVRYASGRALDVDRFLATRGIARRIGVVVAEFSGVAPFVRGSRRLATLPALTAVSLMQGLAHVAPPEPCPPLPMCMVWHRRLDADPLQRWLRQGLRSVVAPALAEAGVVTAGG